jgi:plasmid maintenance system antidote protein VapI
VCQAPREIIFIPPRKLGVPGFAAKGSGVSQSIVNRFVSGERGISFETAAKLCAYLKLDLR